MFAKFLPILRYFKLTIEHKAFVFWAGVRWVKAPLWLLIIHDWTKFMPSEAPHYAKRWYGGGSPDDIEFAKAWNHHSKANPHHWEYWVPVTNHVRSTIAPGPLPMPEKYVREMLSDWFGASRSYNSYPDSPETWKWWQANKDVIRLHPDTRVLLEKFMQEAFARKNKNVRSK